MLNFKEKHKIEFDNSILDEIKKYNDGESKYTPELDAFLLEVGFCRKWKKIAKSIKDHFGKNIAITNIARRYEYLKEKHNIDDERCKTTSSEQG
jgi:hypothetical protein